MHVEMKKNVIIGVIVIIIIAGIIGVLSSSNIQTSVESPLEIIEEPIIEEEVSESNNQGRELSVELTEDFGLSSGP